MQVTRATFDKVKEAQLQFIFDVLEELIDKKETVAPKSRRDYFDLLAVATLGEMKDQKYTLKINGNTYDLGNLSIFARKLAYFEDTSDKKQPLKLKGQEIRVPVEELWKNLQENLYIPFDKALLTAHHSSSEILKHSREGLEFTPTEE